VKGKLYARDGWPFRRTSHRNIPTCSIGSPSIRSVWLCNSKLNFICVLSVCSNFTKSIFTTECTGIRRIMKIFHCYVFSRFGNFGIFENVGHFDWIMEYAAPLCKLTETTRYILWAVQKPCWDSNYHIIRYSNGLASPIIGIVKIAGWVGLSLDVSHNQIHIQCCFGFQADYLIWKMLLHCNLGYVEINCMYNFLARQDLNIIFYTFCEKSTVLGLR